VAHDVMALHGFTGSPDDFESLRLHLPMRSWRGVELYGHSEDSPRTPLKDAWSVVADRVASELSPDTVLLGYSMGGRVALQVAVSAPERLSALILVGATPGLDDPRQRRAADLALADHIESIPIERFLSEWAEKPIIASQRAIAEPYRLRMQARKSRLLPWGLANSLRGIGTGAMPSLWQRLPTIPTLLITGERDEKFTDIARRMCEAMPSAHHTIIAGVGHCAHLEAPSEAAVAISDFLAAVG
jgi:2-succinyl-6-hydroxy-2,4-cyclohexadiene-1-carboxylate synthase